MTYGKKALKQYQSVNVTSGIDSASPHQLVSMLFTGALTAMNRAKGLIEAKDIPGKNEQIQKATQIIVSLKGSLDHEQGGEVASNLDALYDYMLRRLMEANRGNNTAAIDEVAKLVLEVKAGWDAMPEEHRG